MGKWSLLMVLGFSMIALNIMPRVNKRVNDAFNNFVNYQDLSVAHNIAVSAANMAANMVFESASGTMWTTGFPSTSFNGGTFTASVSKLSGVDSADYKIVAIGNFQSVAETCTVILEPGSFARFAYFSNIEGAIQWATQDTVWGPMHTQDVMNISGSPTFFGKVTALKGTNPTKSSANFLGGYQSGVNIPLPGDLTGLTTAATANGKVATANKDLYVIFKKDSVKYAYVNNKAAAPSAGSYTSTTLSAFTANGVVVVPSGDLHVEGTFKGKATFATTGTGHSVYIDSSIHYNQPPAWIKDNTGKMVYQDTSSEDLLGICSKDSIIVSDNATNNKGINIDAVMFCLTGGFGAQDYASLPICGNLTIYGGVQQNQRDAVGVIGGGGTITNGYQKNYNYDNRLMTTYPPSYPATGTYQIISWLE